MSLVRTFTAATLRAAASLVAPRKVPGWTEQYATLGLILLVMYTLGKQIKDADANEAGTCAALDALEKDGRALRGMIDKIQKQIDRLEVKPSAVPSIDAWLRENTNRIEAIAEVVGAQGTEITRLGRLANGVPCAVGT